MRPEPPSSAPRASPLSRSRTSSCSRARPITCLTNCWRPAMSPDPLDHPIAVLTDHRLLPPEEEAALIEVMLAGMHARAVLPATPPTAVAATRDQAIRGEQARVTLVRHNMR